jgi:hypothetical protein
MFKMIAAVSSSNNIKEESELDKEHYKARERERKHIAVGSEVWPSCVKAVKANLICAGCLQHISPLRIAGSLRQRAM